MSNKAVNLNTITASTLTASSLSQVKTGSDTISRAAGS